MVRRTRKWWWNKRQLPRSQASSQPKAEATGVYHKKQARPAACYLQRHDSEMAQTATLLRATHSCHGCLRPLCLVQGCALPPEGVD
ncbi:Hypothetical predicted protein [Pelobates cultripes]|uniref:Uncharacterized protein n=1 Tax=Pelobates cultripes TaxID=61616 RepID=A0AAD1R921_PELCU|nr:Hypothetical predicted protein [Pelobates cultripes]